MRPLRGLSYTTRRADDSFLTAANRLEAVAQVTLKNAHEASRAAVGRPKIPELFG